MKITIAKQLAKHLVAEVNIGNSVVDHLSSLGVMVNKQNIVIEGKKEFKAFKTDAINELVELGQNKQAAKVQVGEFLIGLGYRERAERKSKGDTKKAEDKGKEVKLKRARAMSVKVSECGKYVEIGEKLYKAC